MRGYLNALISCLCLLSGVGEIKVTIPEVISVIKIFGDQEGYADWFIYLVNLK